MLANRPEFEATAQDTVVVVTDLGDHNLAAITTTLTVEGAPGVVERAEKVRLAPDDDRNYTLVLTLPEPEVVKDAPWVVTVLLPKGAELAGPLDAEFVAADDGTRPIIRRSGQADPDLSVIWRIVSSKP